MLNFCRLSALLLTIGILVGCSDTPLTPEAQLAGLIDTAELAVEERDLAAVMELVDPQYLDTRQRDWRRLRAMLAGYFLRHPSIYVISKVDRIELLGEREAEVLVFAGLAGSAQEDAGPLTGWRGNLLRLDLVFRRNDDEIWRLHQADWRPATREDFTQ